MSITATYQRWIDECCSRFEQATGFPLLFDQSGTLPLNWATPLSIKGMPAGKLGIRVRSPADAQPGTAGTDQRHANRFESACDMAETMASLLQQILDQAGDEEPTAAEFEQLLEVHARTVRTDQPVDALQELLKACVSLTEFRSAALFLLDPDEDLLRLRVFHQGETGLVPESVRMLKDEPPDLAALQSSMQVIHRDNGEPSSAWLPINALLAVCLPICTCEHPLGTLWVYDRRSRQPDRRELKVLESIAAQTSAVLERIYLQNGSDREIQLRKELEVACDGRDNLLIESQVTPRIEVAGFCTSRNEIGGDLCEVLAIDPDRALIAIADACGHGIPAAMIMSVTRGALHAHLTSDRTGINVAGLMESLNRAICPLIPTGRFVTMLLGIVDHAAGEFQFSSAGHPAPILLQKNGIATAVNGNHGLLLGALPDTTYATTRVQLQHEDALILFTDGITEALSRGSRMFRIGGLLDSVRDLTQASAQQILNRITQNLRQHSAADQESDDQSLVIIRLRSADYDAEGCAI